jgi:D-alanyl-D-alanine carboxypeptidase
MNAGKRSGLRRFSLAAIFTAAALSVAVAAPAEAFAKASHGHHRVHKKPNRHHRKPHGRAAAGMNAESPRYGAIVIDAATGRVLHEKHADRELQPASMTKIMTLLMVFDALKSGELKLDDKITVSARANAMPPTKLGLGAGAEIPVKDAILALVTESANDIASAFGERLGGTEEHFGELMTAKARSLGMDHTTFRNASGLPDPENVSTARDMAKLSAHVIRTYPDYYDYFSTRSFTYKHRAHRNHNNLLNRYPGVDGIKTGYINASGFNLAASAERDGRRVIVIVFGGPSARTRDNEVVRLLNLGFREIQKPAPVTQTKPATSSPSP